MKKIIFLFITSLLISFPILAETCSTGFNQEWKDADTESSYVSECPICMVRVKSATTIFTFEEDGCYQGICVEGIGTNVGKVYENNPRHDISNVSWFIDCSPTSIDMLNSSASNNFSFGFILGVVICLVFLWVFLRKKGE